MGQQRRPSARRFANWSERREDSTRSAVASTKWWNGAVLSECARGMDLETAQSAHRRQENDEDTADNPALGAIRRESKAERRRLSIDRRRRREARGGGVSDDGGAG